MSVATGLIIDAAHPLTDSASDYDPLLLFIGDARIVLLGEASHGTHEFYHARAQITQRLILEKGFNAVAVEADWPDAYRVNRFVQGQSDCPGAEEALSGFQRFPAWMWRNRDVLAFVGWLRTHNDSVPSGAPKTGFYGLDLYSLHSSIEAVLGYLDRVDPEGARRAREHYGCFEEFGEDPQSYGYSAGLGLSHSCEREVLAMLLELQQRAADSAGRDGQMGRDDLFYAEQNALLVKDAEEYYRSMFQRRISSWNVRDTHMAKSLDGLVGHLSAEGQPAKVVVWAHNSHLGDARATDMGSQGELNLGELVRRKFGEESVSVGFTTFTGTVTAASDWGAPAKRKRVRPALDGSYEALFHQTGLPSFLLTLPEGAAVSDALREPMLERAIGVIYRPRSERSSHYFNARLADQFNAVIHFDETRAVEPLEVLAELGPGEAETYPSGV
jgi:erythromycin esterase-like protein